MSHNDETNAGKNVSGQRIKNEFHGTVNAPSIGHTGGNNTVNFNQIISSNDEQKLKELLNALRKEIEDTPVNTIEEEGAKKEAGEAALELQAEVDKAVKDETHKFSKFSMQGLFIAFKKLGIPVFTTAMNVIGQPVLANAAGELAKNLEKI